MEFNKFNEDDIRSSSYYLDNLLEFKSLEQKYCQKISSNYINDIYVSQSATHGIGLFASRNIKKNEFIGEYLGVVREAKEVYLQIESGGYESDYTWDYPELPDGTLLEVDAIKYGNEMRFVNHSKKANLRIEHCVCQGFWRLFFVADKYIFKSEELFVDYGDEYWDCEARKNWKLN